MTRSDTVVLLLILFLFFPASAFGYLDPGTGSLVLQVAVGGLLALAATVKMYWRRIRAILGRERPRS